MMYRPPSFPQPTRRPIELTADVVRSLFAKGDPIIMKDGIVPVEGKVIGWQTTDAGVLGAIVLNQLTDKRVLYGIDFQTGRPRPLGPPRPPRR